MKRLLTFLFFVCLLVLSSSVFAQELSNYERNFRWIVSPMDEGLPEACWFCPIYREIFFLINNLGYYATDNLQRMFFVLLWIGLFAFVVLYVGKHIISFKEIDPSDFWRGLLIGLGKGMIAAILLGNIEAIYHWVLNPAMGLSLGLSNTLVMQSAPANAGAQVLAHRTYSDTTGTTETPSCDVPTLVEASNIVRRNTNYGGLTDIVLSHVSNTDDGTGLLFENDSYKQVMCFMSTVGLSLSSGLALGVSAVNYAIDETWYKHFRELLIGALIVWAHGYLLILFGLKLIDPLSRMALLAVLMPLWVVLWVFPATRGYTKGAWDCFINVIGTFIMLSVVMVIIIHVMSYAMGSPSEVSEIFTRLRGGAVGRRTFEALSWKQGLWCIGYTMVCSKLLGSVEGLVKTFAAGAPDIGAASALENLGRKIAGLGATLGSAAAHGVVSTGKGAVAGGRWGLNKLRGGNTPGEAPARDEHESATSTGSRHFDDSGSAAGGATEPRPTRPGGGGAAADAATVAASAATGMPGAAETAGAAASVAGAPSAPSATSSSGAAAVASALSAADAGVPKGAVATGTPGGHTESVVDAPSVPSAASSSGAAAVASAPTAATSTSTGSDASVVSPAAGGSASSASPARNVAHDKEDAALFNRRIVAGTVDKATQDKLANVLEKIPESEREQKFREMAADEERALRKEEASREREALAREGKLEETRIRGADERQQDIVDAAKWRDREERRKAAEAAEKVAAEERKTKEKKEKMSVAT